MKKPFKTISTTAMAAVFAASVIVPVASAATSDESVKAYKINKVIIEEGGQLVAVDYQTYMLNLPFLNEEAKNGVKYVEFGNGLKVSALNYLLELGAQGNDDEATYSELMKEEKTEDLKDVLEGEINADGDIVVGDVEVPDEGELTVESVTAITDTTSKVTTVTADVKNAEEDATATVALYANGDTTALPLISNTEVAIVEGKISTTFLEVPAGTHKVVVTVGEATSEVEFTVDYADVDAIVKAVNDAVTQTQLFDALDNEHFTDVKADRLPQYSTLQLNAAVETTTIEKIQVNVINTANVLHSVNNATNEIALRTALQDGETKEVFKDVKVANVAEYANNLSVDYTADDGFTREVVQDAINAVNLAQATDAELLVISNEKLTAFEEVLATTGGTATTGATLTAVTTAQTEATTALASASNAELTARKTAADLKVDAINSVILAESNIGTAANVNAAKVAVLNLPAGSVKTGLQVRLDSFSTVTAMNTAADATAALNVLATQNPSGWSLLNGTSKASAAATIFAGVSYTSVTTYNNTVADTIKEQQLVQRVNQATTASAMLQALEYGTATNDSTNTPLLSNVTKANAQVYLAYKNGDSTTTPAIAAVTAGNRDDASKIQTAIVGAANTLVTTTATAPVAAYDVSTVTAHGTEQAAAQAAVLTLPSSTIKDTLDARVKVKSAEIDLTAATKTAADTAVAKLAAGDTKTALENRMKNIQIVVVVNSNLNASPTATEIAAVKTAVEAANPTGWSNLSAAIKEEVATVLAQGSDGSAAAYDAADFTAKVESELRRAAVNNATTAEAMRTALLNHATTVSGDATAYVNLTPAARLEVASTVLNVRNEIATTKRFAVDAAGANANLLITAAIKADTDARATLFTNISTGINNATGSSVIVTALDTYAASSATQNPVAKATWTSLSGSQKVAVADKVLETRPAVVYATKDDPTSAYVSGGHTTLAPILAAIAEAKGN